MWGSEPTGEKGFTAVGFINCARATFAAHGIVRFTRMVTVDGSCYRSAAFAHTPLPCPIGPTLQQDAPGPDSHR